MTPDARIGRLLPLCAVVLGALLLLRPVAADPEVARLIFKSGKDALAKKQWDEAVTKFERALAEDATLTESVYWAALALDKKGALVEAQARYRAFRKAARAKAGGPSKEEAPLLKKADGRLQDLAPAEEELLRLQEAFVAQVLAFARSNALGDRALANRAIAAAKAADPESADASALQGELARAAGPAAAPSAKDDRPVPPAFKKVPAWTDHLAAKGFGSPEGWNYEGDHLQIDVMAGTTYWLDTPQRQGPRYAYEIEARALEAKQELWAVGVSFGDNEGTAFVAFLTGVGTVVLIQTQEEKGHRQIAAADVDEPGLNTWHHLGVLVDKNRIEVWLDAKKVLTHTAPESANLGVNLGIFHQRSRVEIRRLRHGALE
jgi:tetratricopeptide (TPR) repeat protein